MSLWILIPLIYFSLGVIFIPTLMYAAYKLEDTTKYTLKEITALVLIPFIWPLFLYFMLQTILEKMDTDRVVFDTRKIFDRKKLEEEEIDEYNERIGS